jgi:hypothetical protein
VVQDKAQHLLSEIEQYAVPDAKIVDLVDGKTIGRIVSPALPGTNVVVAMMRLDSVGLTGTCVETFWSKTNRVKIGDSEKEFRYLPYLPLWWPDLDPETGKARDEEQDDEEDDAAEEEDEKDKENEKNGLKSHCSFVVDQGGFQRIVDDPTETTTTDQSSSPSTATSNATATSDASKGKDS